MINLLLIVAGVSLLVSGADLLVKGGSSLAKKLGVSDLAVGLTVVAFGTSLPELSVSVSSTLQGNTAIALGNILGSNIANTLLILGICALIRPLQVTDRTVRIEIPLCILAGLIVWVLGNDLLLGREPVPKLSRADGIVLLIIFSGFICYVWHVAKEPGSNLLDEIPAVLPGAMRTALYVIGGLALLPLGGEMVTRGAAALGRSLGVTDSFIGLTVVAVGTSLPELATSVVAVYRKNTDLAVGNVVGSNIFNVFFVLGLSLGIRPVPIHYADNVNIGVVILAAAMLLIAMFTGRRRSLLEPWEGGVMLVTYVAYTGYLISTSSVP